MGDEVVGWAYTQDSVYYSLDIEVRGVVPAGRSRSSRQMANTVASPQKGRTACHDVAAGTTVLITQLPLPLERW